MARPRLQLVSSSLFGDFERTFLSREKSRRGWRRVVRRSLMAMALGGMSVSTGLLGALVLILDAFDLGLAAMAVGMLGSALAGWLGYSVALHLRHGQLLCEELAFVVGLVVFVAFPAALIGAGTANPLLEGSCRVDLGVGGADAAEEARPSP